VVIDAWSEEAPGVFVRPYEHLDLNVGLILGDDSALLIDTRGASSQARELAASVRRITHLPLQLVNTHAHFDHWYGNSVLQPAPVWGHRRFADFARQNDAVHREFMVRALRRNGEESLAQDVARTTLVLPDHIVDDRTVVDLGGRSVNLMYGGRGHTDHDIVAAVSDAEVVFWGDLVESGDDPQFDDAYPREWGLTVSRLLDTIEVGLAKIMVPGHGAVMGRNAVESQCDQLQRLAWFLGEGIDTGDRDPDQLLARTRSTGLSDDALRVAIEQALL
jgi:glyoxylase-like metal-dependent hydrolase (beta-lactamase superfamily II)